MSAHEADFYLSEAGDDVEAARRQMLADLAWEREGGSIAPEALVASRVWLGKRLAISYA